MVEHLALQLVHDDVALELEREGVGGFEERSANLRRHCIELLDKFCIVDGDVQHA
jgi:dUTPase